MSSSQSVSLLRRQETPGWGEQRAVLRAAGPGEGDSLVAALVSADPDLVVRGDAGVLGFQPPDALPDLVEPLVGAGARQPVVELRQGGLEAAGETLDDGSLLLGPLLGVTVQAHFVAVGGDHLVQLHGLVRLGLDRYGGRGIELAMAFAADDQITVAVLAQPLDAGFSGDAAVHHHQGAGRRLQRLQHAGPACDAR